jgi:CRISPR/Cas system-associated protein Cas10 (large subunit of type III CRISPR-Cas system)
MIDKTPIFTARRLRRRAEQDRCSICGRKLQIQEHHVAGRNHDSELTAPLCTACHDQVTENLRCADVDMRYTQDSVERVRRALKATAIFLRMLAEALWRWAESLLESEDEEG